MGWVLMRLDLGPFPFTYFFVFHFVNLNSGSCSNLATEHESTCFNVFLMTRFRPVDLFGIFII